MTGDGGEYLRAEDLRELGDDSLPGHYLDGFSYMSHNLDRYIILLFWFLCDIPRMHIQPHSYYFSNRPPHAPIHSFHQKEGVFIEDMLSSHQVRSKPSKSVSVKNVCEPVLNAARTTDLKVSALSREDKESFRLSWGAEHLDNVVLSSTLLHSGYFIT